jgi:hypothetical protein
MAAKSPTLGEFRSARQSDAMAQVHDNIGGLPDDNPLKVAYGGWIKSLDRGDGNHDPKAQAAASAKLAVAAKAYKDAKSSNDSASLIDGKAKAALEKLGAEPPANTQAQLDWRAARRKIREEATARAARRDKVGAFFGRKDDGDDLEVKGDSETLSEMELLLARRAQLGA